MTEYYDLGAYTRVVTGASAEAQVWFDRGLNWLYGFNHAEAAACFQRAIEIDPDCAMARWGVAMAVGPNYNLRWDRMDPITREKSLGRAYSETQSALAISDLTPVETDLTNALTSRYPQVDPIDEQMPWNHAFTNTMRGVYEAHPDDPDVIAVFVDAILNETPWQMWDLKSGEPAEGAGSAGVVADDFDEKLTALLDRVKTDDEARQQYVDLLEVMGPEDPRTAEYRKQLSLRLF